MLRLMRRIIQQFLVRPIPVLLLAMMASWPSIALAQTAPPPPALTRTPQVWVGYLVMALLLAVVLAVSLMPSKRSHQD